MDENSNLLSAALETGAGLGTIREIQGTPFAVIPNGWNLAEMERYLTSPTRKRGKVKLTDAASFASYVNAHKLSGTAIFARKGQGASFVAILDHHEPSNEGKAGWGHHIATFAPVETVEWTKWRTNDRVKMSHVDFASFLEDNQLQIVTPTGAEILEIASRIEAVSKVSFTSGVRLSNGNQELKFEETTEAKAGNKGALVIPTQFELGLAIFEGSDAYKVGARLRYRIEDKVLKLWYELVTPHIVVKDALDTLAKEIEEATAIVPLSGEV